MFHSRASYTATVLCGVYFVMIIIIFGFVYSSQLGTRDCANWCQRTAGISRQSRRHSVIWKHQWNVHSARTQLLADAGSSQSEGKVVRVSLAEKRVVECLVRVNHTDANLSDVKAMSDGVHVAIALCKEEWKCLSRGAVRTHCASVGAQMAHVASRSRAAVRHNIRRLSLVSPSVCLTESSPLHCAQSVGSTHGTGGDWPLEAQAEGYRYLRLAASGSVCVRFRSSAESRGHCARELHSMRLAPRGGGRHIRKRLFAGEML